MHFNAFPFVAKKMKTEIIVLAAGQGTRMRSKLPKVLHEIGGRSLLAHVVDVANALQPVAVHLVHGHGAKKVRASLPEASVNWVLQSEQLGTGHAVNQAMPHVDLSATVLVLYGDVPLVRIETLRGLIMAAVPDKLALLTAVLDDPANYGRIVRDTSGRVMRIVEKKDATDQELKVKEINTGFLAVAAGQLRDWLAQLRNDNAQGEYYLTDIISLAVADGVEIVTHHPKHRWEILGVNSKTELAQLERIHQNSQADQLMQQGVTLRDPARFDLRGELKAGRDVVIDVNVVMEGKIELGDGVYIGPNNFLRDVTIAANTQVLPNCVIEESRIGTDCRIGPFARLRPGTRLADHVHVGNFVEVKNAELGSGSKANHLSYVGDSTVGKDVNIGAGTITCNYDGADKHRTVIKDKAFIGSNTALVAPVTVGEGATIGAGSVIAKDAPSDALTITRAEQRTVKGWKRPRKKEKSP